MPAPLDDGTMSDRRTQVFGKGQPSPDILLYLAPVLPKTMLPWALKITYAVPAPGLRALLLAALAAKLTGRQRNVVYGQAVQAVRESLELDLAFNDWEAGVVALAWMSLHLHGSLLRTALEVALHAPADFRRSAALVGLMPHLSRDQQEQALDAVLSMDPQHRWEYTTAGALSGMAPHVKGKSRSKIEQAAAQLNDDEYRQRVMAALDERPATPPVDAQAALNEARAIVDPYWKLQALMAVAPYLPESERQEVFREAFALAPTIPHEGFHGPAQARLAARPDVQAAFVSGPVRQMQSLEEPVQSIFYQTTLSELGSSMGADLTSAGARDATRKIPPRYVNTGFAEPATPDTPQAKNMPLALGHPYYFWLEVGRLERGTIEVEPALLPVELLPQGAILHVALFGFDGELEIDEGANVGALKLGRNGTVTVERQPLEGHPDRPASKRWGRRLFFPVRTPAHAGTFRMRCNIYYNQVLIQSRLVSVTVMAEPASTEGALRAMVDYTLDRSLDLARLAELRPHRFSLMLNDNGNGTHSFRFFGSDGEAQIARTATIGEGTVSNLIDLARKALRHVSWGDDDEWDENKTYRYNTPPDLDGLACDLGRLAVKGYEIYDWLNRLLWISRDQPLAQRIYKADPVQIGLKEGAPFVLPAALIYDYHWDTQAFPLDGSKGKYQLCPSFQKAMQDSAPLEDCECFRGQCPVKKEGDQLRSDPTKSMKDLGPKICPSGFWGFRHSLGLPVTVSAPFDPDSPSSPDHGALGAPITIPYADAPGIGLAISNDDMFNKPPGSEHVQRLRDLIKPAAWNPCQEGRTREDIFKMLKQIQAQLIYFYCHGGVSKNGTPFLDVGTKESWITPDNFNAIEWPDPGPHPLVFLNACHSVAVAPEQALQFVSTFVYAQAAGVIGTEITVMDSLANDFAEECLSRFVNDSLPIGEAVRRARLALLKKRNPLGLVYTPFVVESVRLIKTS